MSSFILKIIAIISMFCDHSGYIIFNKFSFMNYIGRLAFPIFAFQLTEGYKHTKDVKKYFWRLLLFALVSQVPFMLFLSTFSNEYSLNIFFTLSLGLLTIFLFAKSNNSFLKILILVSSCVISEVLKFDYGWFGIATIFIFFIEKDNKLLQNILFFILVAIYYSIPFINTHRIEYLIIIPSVLLSLIPINLYNGKKGKSMKYFFYIFYPVHLLLLYFYTLIK